MIEIIEKYYAVDSDAYRILVAHSRAVAAKAIEIAKAHPEMNLDIQFVEEAAMLHDIGVFLCDAPGIDCHGSEPYIRHGVLGAELLRREGLPRHADVAERHTGTGLTAEEIVRRELPLPAVDLCPRSLEEQLVCFADKFFSKTRLDSEKSVELVRRSLSKHGEASVAQFDRWYELFLP